MSPVLGIVCYGRGKDPERFSLPMDYVTAVRRAGGFVVLLPPVACHPEEVLEVIDGLILAGGGDLAPDTYGGPTPPMIYGVDPERDRMEIELVRESIEQRLPTLAICRGLQILNVALGGDLVGHIPDVVGHRVAHREREGQSARHTVQVDPGSSVSSICGATTMEVASLHHQAVGRLGRGVRSVGRSEDGTIEAIEVEGHQEIVAVQWHPEETAEIDPMQQRLFDWIVRSAGNGS